jgi:four helix bundle protein
MKTFRDLLIWQKSMDLVILVYENTDSFPDSEKYGLVSQIRRAALSLPTNIAEGYGRNTSGEFQRFLNITMGSLFEIQTQFELANRLALLPDSNFKELFDRSREIERMISSFIRSLNN